MQKRHNKKAVKKAKPNLRKTKKAAPAVRRKAAKRAAAAPKVKAKLAAKPRKGELLKKQAEEAALAVENTRIIATEKIVSDALFTEFVTKNVGKQGADVVKILNSAPHTDDKLAARMETKVNEVRRMLNVLNGYGITKYDINKDSKGWLTFRWYLDREKISTFYEALAEKHNSQKVNLQEGCNDFYYCQSCYKDQRLILPFDSAYELNFKCENCGKIFGVLNKEQASALFVSEKTA